MTKEGRTERRILFGKYRLLHKLGTGRTGTVWLSVHLGLEEYRAIKCVSRRCADYETFRREALILKELHHPGIPMIFDLEEDSEYFYLIEEYLQGYSLYTLIKGQGTLEQADAIHYGMQICGLVEYMHSACELPILYLDLQPNNLMICNGTVKLIDFDHAACCLNANQEQQRYGTKGCAAPEQYTSDRMLDQRTDIYAIGAVLRFMLAGTLKQGESVPGAISEPLQDIIGKCMEPDMDRRFETAKELGAVLRGLWVRELTVDNNNRASPSLIINLAGIRPGAGTTHLAFGLLQFLTEQGYEAFYEEHNQSRAVGTLARQSKSRPDRYGIYRVKGCYMKPWYGPAVSLEEPRGFSVVLRDYGTDWEHMLEDAGQECALIGVAAASAWEEGYALKAARIMKGGWDRCRNRKCLLVFRHMGKGRPFPGVRSREWKELLGHAMLYSSPEYRNPFGQDADSETFFRSIWDGLSANAEPEHRIRGWLKGWKGLKKAVSGAAGTLRANAGLSASSERDGEQG